MHIKYVLSKYPVQIYELISSLQAAGRCARNPQFLKRLQIDSRKIESE